MERITQVNIRLVSQFIIVGHCRQTDRQTGRHAGRQTDTDRHKHIDRQTYRQTDI